MVSIVQSTCRRLHIGKKLRKAIDKGDEVALKTLLKKLEDVISRDFPNGQRVRQNAWTRSQWWQSLRQRAAKKKKAEATRRIEEWFEAPARVAAALGAHYVGRADSLHVTLPVEMLQKIAYYLMAEHCVTKPRVSNL